MKREHLSTPKIKQRIVGGKNRDSVKATLLVVFPGIIKGSLFLWRRVESGGIPIWPARTKTRGGESQ